MRFIMLVTVRTSICKRSAEGIDDASCEREQDRFDEPALMLDKVSPVMRGERGHDVLPFQFAADEIFCAVELDKAVAVDLADKRDAALGDGKSQMTTGIDVMIEKEALREMTAERDGLLIGKLAGRGCLTGDIDGLEGIEASDSLGATQIAGADKVGLLQIAHLMGGDIGIGWPV